MSEELRHGDCREVLGSLPAESVNCVVTSPPFWGLRKYTGNQELVWGDNHCEEHEWGEEIKIPRHHAGETNPGLEAHTKDRGAWSDSGGAFCSRCNAWRGGLGLEPTPELFISHLIEILEAIKRVLRKDGVVFWNLDDTRQGGGMGHSSQSAEEFIAAYPKQGSLKAMTTPEERATLSGLRRKHPIIKAKDLCLIPERFLIRAQEAGWYVRSKIIWAASNPMPESATDRPTDAYQLIYMLTKSPRYWYDQEAVREQHSRDWWNEGWANRQGFNPKAEADLEHSLGHSRGGKKKWSESYSPSGRNLRNVFCFPTQGFFLQMCAKCKRIYEPEQYRRLPTEGKSHSVYAYWGQDGRELEVPLAKKVCSCGSSEFLSHFATYPEELVRRCLLAGCPPYVCPKCGRAWVRILEHKLMVIKRSSRREAMGEDGRTQASGTILEPASAETLGWKASCSCNLPQSECVPGVVLDPFMGSGTTCVVAKKMGRRSIGIDLSEDYIKMAKYRLERTQPALFPVTEEVIKGGDHDEQSVTELVLSVQSGGESAEAGGSE